MFNCYAYSCTTNPMIHMSSINLWVTFDEEKYPMSQGAGSVTEPMTDGKDKY